MISVKGHGSTLSTHINYAKEMLLDVQLLNFLQREISYDHICGKALAYQKGHLDTFNSKSLSMTVCMLKEFLLPFGLPHKHVWSLWTYVVAVLVMIITIQLTSNCLCATVPCSPTLAFVGNDYYCELGDVGTSKGPLTTGILNRSLVGWCWLQCW